MQQDVQLFKLQKHFQDSHEISGAMKNRMADYIAQRREDCLNEIRIVQQKVNTLTRQNQLLYRKNEELLNRQIQLVQNIDKLQQVIKELTDQKQKMSLVLGQKQAEFQRISRQNTSLQHQLSDLQIEYQHHQKHGFQRQTVKRQNLLSLYELSNQECRKLVSQICQIIGVRTPQVIVKEITDRERRLKHVKLSNGQSGYIELTFRKIAEQLAQANRKGFKYVSPPESTALRRQQIFVRPTNQQKVEARILQELEANKRQSS